MKGACIIVESNFGERLRNARTKKGLKQKEVADALDCAATSLTNWEKGTIQPPLDKLAGLCDVYGISALDLLDKRYTYSDILSISRKQYKERTYEEQVAFNFSGSILEKAQDKELKRIDKERENRDYISETTGLTPAAVDALTVDIDTLFRIETDASKVSPVELEALNKLLSCPDGLRALENIALFLRAGDYRFTDGSKSVSVNVGKFEGPGGTVTKSIAFTPDMIMSISRNELLRALDAMRSHIPQEEIEAGTLEYLEGKQESYTYKDANGVTVHGSRPAIEGYKERKGKRK